MRVYARVPGAGLACALVHTRKTRSPEANPKLGARVGAKVVVTARGVKERDRGRRRDKGYRAAKGV